MDWSGGAHHGVAVAVVKRNDCISCDALIAQFPGFQAVLNS